MNVSSRHPVLLSLVSLVWATGLGHAPASAQCGCSTDRMVYKTVYQQQQVTAYRLQYETVYQQQQVNVSRPQWVTETRERRYTVAKPVTETSTREDRHTVMRPVWETETRFQQHVMRKPVTETVMQDRSYVTYEPVTTMRTQYVDQGHFVDQTVYKPGPTRNRLQWLSGSYVVDAATGTTVWKRGGYHWVPTQAPGTCQVQRQYVPQIVAQQIPQTTYVQKVVAQKEPVQVTRYVDEVVNQPIQVQVCKWVQQEVVRPVTVTTQRIEYEQRVEPIQVQVCRWVNETRHVQVPHTVAKWVPHTTTRLVPQTVTMRVPSDPCNTCGGTTTYYPPATTYYSSPTVTTPPPAAVETRKVPTEAKKEPLPDDASQGAAGLPEPEAESSRDLSPSSNEASPEDGQAGSPASELRMVKIRENTT